MGTCAGCAAAGLPVAGRRKPEDIDILPNVRERVGNWRPGWPPAFAMDRLVEAAVAPPAWHGSNRRRELAHWLLARQPLNLWRKTIRPKLEQICRIDGWV